MKHDEPFLRHILEEINFITSKSEGLKYETLIEDETLKRAFLRSLEVIGEATKNLSQNFREKHTEIAWGELTGLRDVLIHRYFGIRWDIVWNVIKDKIPPLKEKIQSLLREIETK